jgi:uncharacterized membrane protein YhaH (DUF805 family)
MNWYREALTKYAVFEGRSRRREYWWFALVNALVALALGMLDVAVGTYSVELEIGLFSGLYLLAVLLPGIAVTVRRLHDTNRSGWWVLIGFVPLVGAIVLIVFACLDSQPGANRYGPNPKGVIGAGTPVAPVVRD